MLVKISQHGHVVIPPFLLEEMGLGPDDELEMEVLDREFKLKLKKKHVKPPPKPVDWSKYPSPDFAVTSDEPPWDSEVFWGSLQFDKEKYLKLYREKYPESGV